MVTYLATNRGLVLTKEEESKQKAAMSLSLVGNCFHWCPLAFLTRIPAHYVVRQLAYNQFCRIDK